MRGTGGERDTLMLAVQIPLAPEAAQLMLTGPATSEGELRTDLAQMLGSLRGRSNWLTVQQRSEKLGSTLGGGIVALTVAAVVWWRWRQRRAAVDGGYPHDD